MNLLKRSVRSLLRTVGYDLTRYPPYVPFGQDPITDISFFLGAGAQPVIFDVGANVGQSVERFKQRFPSASIHSFEASPGTYARLRENCSAVPGVTMWNVGVGASPGRLPFLENSDSSMSSFLEPGPASWGKVEKSTSVEIVTLDAFAPSHGIDFIDLLKSDVQGFDLEVLRGASELMRASKIGLIYLEVIFSDMYRNAATFDEILRFLRTQGFSLVNLYNPNFQENLVGWADALFVSGDFHARRKT